MIHINPFTITTTIKVTSFTVNVIRLELFQSVTLNAMLYGADGNFIEVRTYILSGADYANWDDDDNYLINKVAEKLGCTLAVVPDAVVPDAVIPDAVIPDAVIPDAVIGITPTSSNTLVVATTVTEPAVTEPIVTEPTAVTEIIIEPTVTEPEDNS
jgi:hypothetical protein